MKHPVDQLVDISPLPGFDHLDQISSADSDLIGGARGLSISGTLIGGWVELVVGVHDTMLIGACWLALQARVFDPPKSVKYLESCACYEKPSVKTSW